MFHIYLDVPKEKAGRACACSVSKMLEKTSGVNFPQQNRGEISVNIFTLIFPPQTVFDVQSPGWTKLNSLDFYLWRHLKTLVY
jgi:hypothetical protein